MRIATLFAAAVLGFMPVLACAEDAPAAPVTTATPAAKVFSDSERAGIEAIVKDYLTKGHPEVIMEAVQEIQKRDMATAQVKSEEAVTKAKDRIFDNPNSPVGGNPKGDVVVVEFFDYQCGYCKMSEEAIEKLLKEDKKVKFVYKDFPILGPGSLDAAKAALASIKQDKYIKFHDLLMNKKDHVSDAVLEQTAKDAGLDYAKLKKDMADPSIQKMIDENITLGTDVGIRGTPMFIIGNQIFPGAMQYEQLKKAVDDARTGAKKS